jgi:hypothetical protein
MVLHLINTAHSSLIKSRPTLPIPTLRSKSWRRNMPAAYEELENIDQRKLTAEQVEGVYRLLFLLLLYNSELITVTRTSFIVSLLKSAVRSKASGKKRSEKEAGNKSRRNRWLHQNAEKLRANGKLSELAIARRLAQHPQAFRREGFDPLGSEAIRGILREWKTKLGGRA